MRVLPTVISETKRSDTETPELWYPTHGWGDHFGYPGGPPIFRNLKNDFTCFCPSNRDDFCLLQNLLGIWVSL